MQDGWYVLMGFLFLLFYHPNFKGGIFFSFFTHFELFKRLWVHLIALYTLSYDPINKSDGLNEREVIDTLNV
jgi:hypothetical protein